MDHWMSVEADNGQIVKKCCPKCKTPIRDCLRYGNIIKAILRDVVMVKQKIIRTRENPTAFFKVSNALLESNTFALSTVGSGAFKNHRLFDVVKRNLKSIQSQLEPKKKGKNRKGVNPSHDESKRFFIKVNLDFIQRLMQLFKTEAVKKLVGKSRDVARPNDSAQTAIKADLQSKLCDQVLKLLELLINRDPVIKEEEYRAITAEIDRLDLVKNHFILQSTAQFNSIAPSTAEQNLLDQLLTKNIRILNEEQKGLIKTALQDLAKKLNTGIGISETERKQIVAAFVAKGQWANTKGHWFKCPNGHIYVIDDCGGASVESRCNECGSQIGGTGHRLRQDTRFAPEMDGATAPAWPGSLY